MEDWQKTHVVENLPELLQLIRCNSGLIAALSRKKIIGHHDEQDVVSKNTNNDKTSCLIDILKTRKGGYEGLITALIETQQDGAVHILEQPKSPTKISDKSSMHTVTPIKHDIVMTEEEVSGLQYNWERFMYDKKDVFMTDRICKEAVAEQIGKFYSTEVDELLRVKKLVGISFMETFHDQIKKSMILGLQRIANRVTKTCNTEEIFENLLEKHQSRYISTLNGNLNFNNSPAIGIDLGTCNCCVGVFLNGKVKIFTNNLGEFTTPSYVAYHDNLSETVGTTARRNAYRNSLYTVFDSKRIIGRDFDDKDLQEDRKRWQFQVIEVDGIPKIVTPHKTVSAVEVSARLLLECVQQAEADLQQKITKAVITVPAYFRDTQIKATKEAAELAGLTVLQTLKEPTAAAIMYRQERNYDFAKRVLIFDMGGGTFDVAIADISDNEIDIVGIDGDTHLGGEDFDYKIVNFCIDDFKKTTGIDLRTWKTDANNRRNLALLKFEAEEAKKNLQSSVTAEICVAQDADHVITLTRQKFEELSQDLFDRMIFIVNRLLQKTNVPKEQIEDVILVGGSTRTQKITELLSEYFDGKPLNRNAMHNYAVAYGAAIQAAKLNGEEVKKLLNLSSINDVIPMSIGIQCIVDGVPGKFSKIIQKNSKYPKVYKKVYLTHRDNQDTATIRVFQGENDDVTKNFFIGEFSFDKIPKALRNEENIEVVMEVDTMGIVNVCDTCRGLYGEEFLKISPKNAKSNSRQTLTKQNSVQKVAPYRNHSASV